MLPALRFMLGAALASLLLILTVLGLGAALHLSQQTKVSPFESDRMLAYSAPAVRSEPFNEDPVRHFQADAGVIPLGRSESLIGAAPPQSAGLPEQHIESIEQQQGPLASSEPQERSEAPQERSVETTASITAGDEDRSSSPASAAPEEVEPADTARSAINPATKAEVSRTEPVGALVAVESESETDAMPTAGATTLQAADVAPMTAAPALQVSERADPLRPSEIESAESSASAKRDQPHRARAQKGQKSKAVAAATKIKKTVAKRNTSPAANPLVPGIGFPRPQNWSSAETRIFAAQPVTKLASSQMCGLGSAMCSRPPLRAFPSRQTNLRTSRTRPTLSHPQ
jgi:hypothetical protein